MTNHNHPPLPPKQIVHLLQAFRRWLLSFHNRIFPQQVVVYELFQNYYLLPCLAIAAEFNIAGILSNGKQPIDTIAKSCQADTESLYRVLRALASVGIFREKPVRIFTLTPKARTLLENNPGSLRNVFRHHLSSLNWSMMGELSETVRTGKDGFSRHFNRTIYHYLTDHPDQYAVFDQSMAELTAMGLPAILHAYSFKGIHHLADIGGGEGMLLASLLVNYPSMQGVLFDVPEALKKSADTFHRYQVSDRVTCIEGDFMESVPMNMEAYLLKNVLHNWDDQQCIRLLTLIQKAMPVNGKVIIIEMIIPSGNRSSFAKLIDIQMLATMPGGKERTRQEFDQLCREAGLDIVKGYSTISPVWILEARKNSAAHNG